MKSNIASIQRVLIAPLLVAFSATISAEELSLSKIKILREATKTTAVVSIPASSESQADTQFNRSSRMNTTSADLLDPQKELMAPENFSLESTF